MTRKQIADHMVKAAIIAAKAKKAYVTEYTYGEDNSKHLGWLAGTSRSWDNVYACWWKYLTETAKA